MKTVFFLILTIFSFSIKAEILSYTLDSLEVDIWEKDGSCKTRHDAMTDINKKPTTLSLIIAGIGTTKITAQCHIYSLIKEMPIIPMTYNYGINISQTSGAEWFYILTDQGVTIIELFNKRKNVKLHNLGMVPYTYIGKSNAK